MTTILIATRSKGKQQEIRQIFADSPYRILFPDEAGLTELPEESLIEDTETFEGNARRKAQYFARRSGLPTAGEDSGIEVLSLGGAPGVRSRRFAPAAADQDSANNALLLERLKGASVSKRRARYRSVIAFQPRPDAVAVIFEGACTGSILESPSGTGGFGYDPLFLSDDLGKTFGEASIEEKEAISHRGRAFRDFLKWLPGARLS